MAMQITVDPGLRGKIEEGMPEIVLERELRSKRMLGNLLRIHGPADVPGRQIADGLVRLIEKTLLEYEAARAELLGFTERGFVSRYHRAQDHFESCIHSLHRAITYLDKLRRRGYVGKEGDPLVRRARELEVLSDQVKKAVRDFRDALEHLDDDILDLKLPAGRDVGPELGSHGASIGEHEIHYQDIARWCTQIHEIAKKLSIVQVVAGQIEDQKSG